MTTPSDKTKPAATAQSSASDTSVKPVSSTSPNAAKNSVSKPTPKKTASATASKKPASKPAAPAKKPVSARKKPAPAKSNASPSGNAGQEPIAESIKRFPSRRVWPD